MGAFSAFFQTGNPMFAKNSLRKFYLRSISINPSQIERYLRLIMILLSLVAGIVFFFVYSSWPSHRFLTDCHTSISLSPSDSSIWALFLPRCIWVNCTVSSTGLGGGTIYYTPALQ